MRIIKSFLFLLITAGIFSCNPVSRILKNKEQFDKVGREWLKQNPCANDSTIIYLPSKKDSVIVAIPVLIKDTSSTLIIIDSITQELKKKYNSKKYDCKMQISEAYNLGYDKAAGEYKKKLSNVKVPLPTVDTLKIVLKDKQQINLLTNDLDLCNKNLNESKLNLEKYKGSTDKWFLLFILSTVLLAGSLYFNFKKP